MLTNDIMLSIEYLDKYKCRIEISNRLSVHSLINSLTLFFRIENQELYSLIDKETGKHLQKEQTIADQQVQHEAVLQLAILKVNVTIMNTISGREAIVKVLPTASIDEVLKSALEEPILGLQGKENTYLLKKDIELKYSKCYITENTRFLLLENKKVKIRLQKKEDRNLEKAIKEISKTSRLKAKKSGFSTCDICGYEWVVYKCYKCGKDYAHWLETEQEFESRKANALEEISSKQAADQDKFVEVEVPLSSKPDELQDIFQKAHPDFYELYIDEEYTHSPYYVSLTCRESEKSIDYETDLYDAGVENGNTIEVDISFRMRECPRLYRSQKIIGYPDRRDHHYYKLRLIDFWESLKRSYPELNLFVSASKEGLYLYYLLSGGNYFSMPLWHGSSSTCEGKSIGKWINTLEELNRIKSATGITKYTPDQELLVMLPDYEKYASIKRNGLLLFLEVQTRLIAFEQIYWRKIGALTNGYLDIHYTVSDAIDKARDDFAADIDYLNTLNIILPSLVLWDKGNSLSTMIVIDFSGVTEEVMYDCIEFSVQAIKENMSLCQMAEYIGSETRKSSNAEASQITYLEHRSTQDEEQQYIYNSIIFNKKEEH